MQRTTPVYPHLLYADYIRSYSIIAIVVMHVATRIVEAYMMTDRFDWWVANIIVSNCRWGVPCFVILSGALLLDPSKTESASTFYIKRLHRIGIPVVFWFIIYFFWLHIWYHKTIDLRFILKTTVYWGPFYHLYFLYIIIFLYLITPLVRLFIKSGSPRILKSVCSFLLCIGCINAAVFCFKDYISIPFAIPIEFLFLCSLVGYLGYFITGYILNRIVVWCSAIGRLILAYASGMMVTAMGTYLFMKRFGPDTLSLFWYDYFSPPSIIMSFCIFLMVREWYSKKVLLQKNKKIYQWVSDVFSPATFGIFLVHPIFLDIVENVFPISESQNSYAVNVTQWVRIPLITIMVIALSLVTTTFLRKIPYAKKVVG